MAQRKRKNKVPMATGVTGSNREEVDTELTGKQVNSSNPSIIEGAIYICALLLLIVIFFYLGGGKTLADGKQQTLPTAPIPIGGVLNVVYGNVEENVLVLSNLTEVQRICDCEACLGCYNKYAIGASSGNR